MSNSALSRSFAGSRFSTTLWLGATIACLSFATGARSESDPVDPAFARFRSWTNQYLSEVTSNATQQHAAIAVGVELARERTAALKELIQSDPKRALDLAVPAAIRQRMPSAVLQKLETRVSGIADLSVVAALPKRGGPPVAAIQRVVDVSGQRYRAFVYGRRSDQTTKLGIPVHGIAIDDALALAESSIRQLETDEKPNPAERMVDLTYGAQSRWSRETVFGEVGPTVYRFSSLERLLEAEARLENAEAGIGPKPKLSVASMLEPGSGGLTTDNPQPDGWTTGNQNVLIIRIDFSDLPGDPYDFFGQVYTATYVQTFSDTQIKPYFAASSYGLTGLINTATPQLYRLPHPTSYYITQPFLSSSFELYDDAQTLASADYVLSNYDRIVVLFSDLANLPGSNILFAGLGDVGGPRVWINGAYYWGVVAHELGHTYGMYHAGL